jgi:DNA ligase 1
MITHPTLYARTSTGAVQVWWMERDGNKFRSISGQIDGAKTQADWTICEPKNVGRANATTGEEQALAEVEAKYKKQLKSGGYWTDIKDIDKSRYIEPMLAKSFDDYRAKMDWKAGVGVQIKYNGGRVIATRHGLFTRKGEKIVSVPHIEEGLKRFFSVFPDAVLDGEGFNYDLRENLNEIMSLMRKTVHATPDEIARSKQLIRFYIYDGYGFGADQSEGYLKRKAAIDKAFFDQQWAWRYKDIVHKVPTWIVHSEKELEDLYQTFLKDRQEGAILRILGKPYENKRSKFLLKYKPVMDAEFRVIRINEGNGNWRGMAATVTLQRIDGKKFLDGTDTFDATVKGTEAEKRFVLLNPHIFLNQVATIYFFGYTGYGVPNYAQFDVNNWQKQNV